MPIYEYRCTACRHTFEILQKMSDAEPACEKCGEKVERLISLTSFKLQGSGWHSTDYKSSSSSSSSGRKQDKEKEQEKAKDKTADKDKAGSSSDTKKEAKSDQKDKKEQKQTSK